VAVSDETQGTGRASRGSALGVLLTAGGAIILALAVAEAGLRVYSHLVPNADVEFVRYARLMKRSTPGAKTSFRHAPGASVRLMGVDVTTDDRGFRDEPPVVPPDVRIGLLGDSVTFGWGVRYGERFSELLEERWSAALGRPVELVNTGHGNYNASQERALLEEVLGPEPLDGIVQAWYVNDAEPTPSWHASPWYANLHTAVFLWAKADLLRRRAGARASYVDYYRGLYEEGAPGLAEFRSALDGIGEWAAARNLPWVFVILPEFHGFAEDGPFRGIYALVAEEAARAGARVVDVTGAFRDTDPRTVWVAYNDVHPNDRGHAIVAEAIATAVDPRLFEGGGVPEVAP
jgi:lysophospholipase L1-like esterase